MVMEGCPTCEWVRKADSSNIILQNEHAIASAADEWREGHCIVTLKKHVSSAFRALRRMSMLRSWTCWPGSPGPLRRSTGLERPTLSPLATVTSGSTSISTFCPSTGACPTVSTRFRS